MSDAAPAPAAPLHTSARAVRRPRNRLNPLEALERGFALFRSTFVQEAWRYYAGSAPLIFCFIPIWVLNGQIQISGSAVLLEAVLLAATYLLRVCMIATYMQRVRERAFGTPTSKSLDATSRAAPVGRLLAWKITLSACAIGALVIFAGAPWFYSACQFASLEAQEDRSERHSMRGCLAIANEWFGNSLLFLLMLFPFWIAVWLNGLILAMVLPQLLHSIFGVNTLLSTATGVNALLESSAFWLSVFAGAWLALDPIIKCSYVIVYQHLRSRREGDDLRGLLAGLPRDQQKKAQMIASAPTVKRMVGTLVILIAILAGIPQIASAEQTPPSAAETSSDSTRQARVQRLQQALDTESRRAIYRWHDAEHQSPPNWFDKLIAKIGRWLGHWVDRIWSAIRNFLRKLLPKGLNPGSGGNGSWQLKSVRT